MSRGCNLGHTTEQVHVRRILVEVLDQTVAAGALGVDDAVTLEAASADIRLSSRNNKREYRL